MHQSEDFWVINEPAPIIQYYFDGLVRGLTTVAVLPMRTERALIIFRKEPCEVQDPGLYCVVIIR